MNSRANRVLGIAVAALLLLAVVAAVLSSLRSEPDLPAGSPEAAVQDYLAAVYAGDSDAAAEHLDPEGGCLASDLDQAWVDQESRAVLRDSREQGGGATVRIDLVRSGSGPFGSGEWTEEQTFRLRQVDGAWVITGTPWPTHVCIGEEGR